MPFFFGLRPLAVFATVARGFATARGLAVVRVVAAARRGLTGAAAFAGAASARISRCTRVGEMEVALSIFVLTAPAPRRALVRPKKVPGHSASWSMHRLAIP